MILITKGIVTAAIALLQFILGVFMVMEAKEKMDKDNDDKTDNE